MKRILLISSPDSDLAKLILRMAKDTVLVSPDARALPDGILTLSCSRRRRTPLPRGGGVAGIYAEDRGRGLSSIMERYPNTRRETSETDWTMGDILMDLQFMHIVEKKIMKCRPSP